MKYDARIFGRARFTDHQGSSVEGIQIGPFDDTMLLSYVLDGGLHGHGMDDLAEPVTMRPKTRKSPTPSGNS